MKKDERYNNKKTKQFMSTLKKKNEGAVNKA